MNTIKITLAAGYREDTSPCSDTTFEILATVNGETFEIGELTAERSGWNRETREWVNDIGYLNYATAWMVSEYRFDLGLDDVTFGNESVVRGEFPSLGQWLRDSDGFGSIERFDTCPLVPGSSQRLKQTAELTKREAKERIAEVVEAYLEAIAHLENMAAAVADILNSEGGKPKTELEFDTFIFSMMTEFAALSTPGGAEVSTGRDSVFLRLMAEGGDVLDMFVNKAREIISRDRSRLAS